MSGDVSKSGIPSAAERLERRLSAICSVDMKDYSRFMSIDEVATHKVTSSRLHLLEALLPPFKGRVVCHTGDGMMLEFGSVVNALEFSLQFQREMTRHRQESEQEPEPERVAFRVGINLADVMIEDGNIFGDGVNVTKRLEGLAPPGGICISRAVYDQVRGKADCGFESLGAQQLKNIVDPVDVFRVRLEETGAEFTPHVRQSSEPLVLPRRPSIAVLPFVDFSAEGNQGFLCDGIAEDIITNLSRFRELFVISRNSSFVYKNVPTKAERMGRDLGVRYLLEGSVRRSGQRVRVAAQLIDALHGNHLWADAFDRDLTDLFEVQNELTRTIAMRLVSRMEDVERHRTVRAETRDLEAYGLLLRGEESFFLHTKEGNAEARKQYERAIDRDPDYARAYAALSRTYNYDWRYLWSETPSDAIDKAYELARKAVQLDEGDARGHSELGFVYLWKKSIELSIQAYERALELNPNDADIMAEYADALSYDNKAEQAAELLKSAMRLNPFYPDWYLWYLADAYYVLRRYRDVIATLRQMRNPGEGHRLMAASHAQLGELDEARLHAKEVLRRQPNFSARRWAEIQPDVNRKVHEHFVEGLLKAGLPA